MSEIDDAMKALDQAEREAKREREAWLASGLTNADSLVVAPPAHVAHLVLDFAARPIKWKDGLIGIDPHGKERLREELPYPTDPKSQPRWRDLTRADRRLARRVFEDEVDRYHDLKKRLRPIGFVDFGHDEYSSLSKSEVFVTDFTIVSDGRVTADGLGRTGLDGLTAEQAATRFAQYLR